MTFNPLVLVTFAALVFSYTVGGEESSANNGSTNWAAYATAVATCERETMTLGTEIVDWFNAPVDHEDWNERVHQDKIIEKLGFAPWVANGISGSGGKTMQHSDARQVYEKSGWGGGKNIDGSPYASLNHKWIYMFGDSTTRQIWASFAAPFQGNNFERNAKEWTRHYCNGQGNRKRHEKHKHYDEEGWRGPCGVNEVTCHVSGYGDKGVLSFDWKHFPYEDYDEWMWGPNGPWIGGFPGEGVRRPDILTIQLGMHSCWHSNPEAHYSKHLTAVNTSMVEQHLRDVVTLMQAIRRAIDTPSTAKPIDGGDKVAGHTTVIVVTSGSAGLQEGGLSVDACVQRFNRVAEQAAHDAGFLVLERGELEHRLMYKSSFAENPLLRNDMHLPQPAQNIISTCLLNLITCADKHTKSFNVPAALAARKPHQHSASGATPLHSPPS
mmetsp:Transcript_27178/g.45830  ORF Transcript_27178/g.45830 Transcript_27178/m.45830 type:complete len:438 (+) Transcript_27178:61-1374(+)